MPALWRQAGLDDLADLLENQIRRRRELYEFYASRSGGVEAQGAPAPEGAPANDDLAAQAQRIAARAARGTRAIKRAEAAAAKRAEVGGPTKGNKKQRAAEAAGSDATNMDFLPYNTAKRRDRSSG